MKSVEANSGAVISEDGLYRYLLWRDLREQLAWTAIERVERPMLFIMLNPSTADAEVDDPTIRRCRGFAARSGCTRLEVVNLFAWRATKPADLLNADWPIGDDNAMHIIAAIRRAEFVVAAWGAWWEDQHVNRRPPRLNVEQFVHDAGKKLWCLGETKKGQPRHPLYAPNTSQLRLFEPRHVSKRR